MEINILHNYREMGGFEIELENEKTVKLMVIRHNVTNNLIACQIQGRGRVILWSGEDTANHINDTEEQFIERIISLITNQN
jgi:hypothetical protein